MERTNEEKHIKNWSHQDVRLLLAVRLAHEQDFCSGKRKKSSVWTVVLNKMLEDCPQFSFTKEEIIRKWNNLLLTYKRIKDRNGKSGRDATRWEFFDLFHEVYGTKHFIDPPKCNLMSTLNGSTSEESETEDDEAPSCSYKPPAKNQRRKTAQQEMLDFLKHEAEEEEKRHQQQMNIEMQRMEILKSIKDLLDQTLMQGE